MLELINTSLFSNVNPTKVHWLAAGAGISGLSYVFLTTKSCIGLEFTISRASKQENKRIYNVLFLSKNIIESRFGNELIWEELSEKK